MNRSADDKVGLKKSLYNDRVVQAELPSREAAYHENDSERLIGC